MRCVGVRGRAAVVAIVAAGAALVGCADAGTGLPPVGRTVSDPSAAVLVADDIARYWEAVDSGADASDFESRYLARGTAGLRDFAQRRQLTGQSLRQAYLAFPAYFASIRATTLSLGTDTAVINRVRRNYAAMKAIYPAATFPPVTFLIGRFSTGGTIGGAGMLIGAEFYTKAPGSPLGELPPFQRNNVRPVDSLAIIVAHEHVHTLQMRAGGLMGKPGQTLLEQAFLEGTADFLGELVSGGNINAGLRAWALPREDSLWTAFSLAMNGTDVSAWLYNQGNATASRPGDLGYFIGYRIAESYYDPRADKRQAVHDLIHASNATLILLASGYVGQAVLADRTSP